MDVCWETVGYQPPYWVRLDSWVIHGPWPCEVYIPLGRNEILICSLCSPQSFLSQWCKRLWKHRGTEGSICLPGRAQKASQSRWDRSDHRTISRALQCDSAWTTWQKKVVCTSGASRGMARVVRPGCISRRRLVNGAPTCIPQGLAGPGMGKCLPKASQESCFYVRTCPLPAKARPERVLTVSHIWLQYWLEAALEAGDWNGGVGKSWAGSGFMVSTKSFGLYFAGNQGVLGGFW